MAYQEIFTITLSPAASEDVTINYATADGTAVAYTDYVPKSGTLTFKAGTSSMTVAVPILGDTTSLNLKEFVLNLSSPSNGATMAISSATCRISGPPAYQAVSFPGYRVGIVGDSIYYACQHYNPAIPVTISGVTLNLYEYYGHGGTAWYTYFNALCNQAFELEPALQPNTNPGVNSQGPHNGYNFSIYSSQVAQWLETDFDPMNGLGQGGASHNIGPLYNADQYIDKFDIAFMLGGTNDLAIGDLPWQTILQSIKSAAYNLAKQGKWVFVSTITPRSADMFQAIDGVGGYTQDQVIERIQSLIYINQGLRSWIPSNDPSDTSKPPNIFLVDPWDNIVGPTATILTAATDPALLNVPTDPGGWLSPSSGIVSGSVIPSQAANYRADAPNTRFMYDGLHPGPAAGYAMAKAAVDAVKAAGIVIPSGTPTACGPLTIGPNLITNPTFTNSNIVRSLGETLVCGRSTCLGTPVGWVSPGFPSASNLVGKYIDQNAPFGQGYQYGPVPDHWFLYRECNGNQQPPDGPELDPSAPSGTSRVEESYSNFVDFTFSNFSFAGPGGSAPAPASWLVDSTWAAGALTTEMTTVNGTTAYQLNVNFPSGLTNNEGFTLLRNIPDGQHGIWDNYGYEGTSTPTPPTPPYNAGDYIFGEMEIDISNMSGQQFEMRLVMNFLSVDNNQVAAGNTVSTGAVISGMSGLETFFPFSDVVNIRQHPENKTLLLRTAAVKAPTPLSGQGAQYAQLVLQSAWNCETEAATATFKIYNVRVAKITGPTL